jgi:hypothetical protein
MFNRGTDFRLATAPHMLVSRLQNALRASTDDGGTTLPLSEHEQRLLEQMEQALSAEDPKFATAMRGADLRRRYRRRAIVAVLMFIVGIAVLMTGAVSEMIPVGVAGFVVMLASSWFGVTAWRRTPAEGDLGTFPTAEGGQQSGRPSKKQRGTMMQRLEERWRRRRENGPGGRP